MTPIEEWYYDIPIISRIHCTLVFLTTLACQLDLVSPFHLYFSMDLIKRGQYWRLFTSFLYCGNFSIDFLFHMFFLVRYSRMLEEGSFRGRTLDFLWMLVLGAVSMVCITPFLWGQVQIPFLSSPLTFMLVYIWSRRNPGIRMNFLGLFTFTAPYLPWVLLGFTVLLNNVFPAGDLLGMSIAHVYYFLEDVYPRMQGSGGKRWLKTPWIVEYICGGWRDSGNAEIPESWNQHVEQNNNQQEQQQPQQQQSSSSSEQENIQQQQQEDPIVTDLDNNKNNNNDYDGDANDGLRRREPISSNSDE